MKRDSLFEVTLKGTAAAFVSVGLFAVTSISTLAQPVRDVTPPGMTRVYGVEKLAPLEGKGLKEAHASSLTLGPMRVLVDGTVVAPSGRIRLYGVKIPDTKKICHIKDGARWACGSRAIAALRGLLNGQMIECAAPSSADDPRICWNGETDISAWLLERGWATLEKPDAEKLYIEAVEKAKGARFGLWAE